MKLPHTLWFLLVVIAAAVSGAVIWRGEESASPLSAAALREIAQVEHEIDRIEAQTLKRLAALLDNQVQQIELLGKAMLYDKQLSVNQNEACAFCHMPETGFTGPVSELNRTTGSYPGSVRTRFSERKPQSHSYAPLSPVLHYNAGQDDLVGGNFWDMRATGRRLGNPAAEQAEAPPTNPVEMGLPDIACAVYRVSQRPYRALFENVWGPQAFAIAWPDSTERVCNNPGPPPADEPSPVHLGPLDRGRAATTFDQMALSIASYEASHEVTAFSSKFDAVQAGKAQFTSQEKIPYVSVLPDGRRLKTDDSLREIPLVGVALAALKMRPEGFPRYRDNSSTFSATANKFLLENGLRPTEEHTVYSLRHSFKDRLIAIEAQDSLIDSLMGHDTYKPKYGKGPSLELKRKNLQRIAFKPPPSLR